MYSKVISILSNSRLFKDSFWAVTGNGIGYVFLLMSGIIIARFLGKDVYGEYGVVKTTMFYLASFATLGLHYTSTKYVAEYNKTDKSKVKSVSNDSIFITLCSSVITASVLFVFSNSLAEYLGTPNLGIAFRFLGGILICRSLYSTTYSILGGFGSYKTVAINSIFSGLTMLVLCVPLTYFWGLIGAFISLLTTQALNMLLNLIGIGKIYKTVGPQIKKSFKKELLKFSFPVALQELSFTICNWGGLMLLVKLSNSGELGIFTATQQWNTIIMFVPGLLGNVLLSHLSGGSSEEHKRTVKKMLVVNLVCTVLPFAIVYTFSDFIVSFYGPTFVNMKSCLRILTFTTIVLCCSDVLRTELLSLGRNWLLLFVRFSKDTLLVVIAYVLLTRHEGENGAIYYAYAAVVSSITYLILLLILYFRLLPVSSDCNKGGE